MASLPKKTISPATPQFYKVVRSLGETKFRVPKTFVSEYGDDLSNPVCLEVPGSKWKVELRRRSGEVWFAEGWAEFSEFYGLDTTNCLIFRYEGDSMFEVCILDATTGTEIEYPVSSSEMEESDEDDDEKSVEILDEFELSPLPPKKNRANTSSASSSRAAHAKDADKFVSKWPFFRATITSIHKMYCPAGFWRQYLPKQPEQIVTLRVQDKWWHVKLIDNQNRNYAFSGGWTAFARENDLKRGDCCMCELIDKKNVVLRVNIFRC